MRSIATATGDGGETSLAGGIRISKAFPLLIAAVLAAVAAPAVGQHAPLRPVGCTSAMRIVSTAPSITESLFALGLGDRVVGVSQFCRYPPQVQALPKVGTVLRADVEAILALRPDLVVINSELADVARRLDTAGIPSVLVTTGTLADARETMLRIGRAVGIEAHARDVVTGIDGRLASIRQASRRATPPRVLLIVGRTSDRLTGIVAAGRHTYLDELIDIAGGTNVLTDDTGIHYPHLTIESILRLNPDVIVDTAEMHGTEIDRRRREDVSRRLWSRFPNLAAVRTGRIRVADIDALFVPGPRVVDAAEWLAGVIHAPTWR